MILDTASPTNIATSNGASTMFVSSTTVTVSSPSNMNSCNITIQNNNPQILTNPYDTTNTLVMPTTPTQFCPQNGHNPVISKPSQAVLSNGQTMNKVVPF